MAEVNFYLSSDGTNWIDIESHYSGMRYLKCLGLEDKGKPKNKYQEVYADAAELRVYEPDEVMLEATYITFTFIFVGENRQEVYEQFYQDIQKGKFYYYDTKRYKKAYITLFDAVKPSDDNHKGSTPYIQADFKFKNLWGKCISVEH